MTSLNDLLEHWVAAETEFVAWVHGVEFWHQLLNVVCPSSSILADLGVWGEEQASGSRVLQSLM